MKNNCIEISVNDHRKSLPDAALNSVTNEFLVVWAAAPGEESKTFEYYISGQKISATGELIGETIEILKTEDIVMMSRILYNPNKNQYLVIYCLGLSNFNIHGVILDAEGRSVCEQFRIVDAPANQFITPWLLILLKIQYFYYFTMISGMISVMLTVLFLDDTGKIVKDEFMISNSVGHQVNPVVCYNPKDNTYLVNWEDFRAHGDVLTPLGTLEVMTDISGALLSSEGKIIINDIPLCMDANGANADQRFNGLSYNSKTNRFLISWTDTRDSLQNTGVMGRIVEADGTMSADDFPLIDVPGAQMISHTVYVPEEDKYFISFERDLNDLDAFILRISQLILISRPCGLMLRVSLSLILLTSVMMAGINVL